MIWTVVGMAEHEYVQQPFWMNLPRQRVRPNILGISANYGEHADYANLCAKFGRYYQFFLLDDRAVQACSSAKIKLKILGSIAYAELTSERSVFLGARPLRRSA
jgi:hypothetical protein